jgi:hypothetical protein
MLREHRSLPEPGSPSDLDDRVRQLIEGPPRPLRTGRSDGVLVVALVAIVIGAGLVLGGGADSGTPPGPACAKAGGAVGRVSDAGFGEGSSLPSRTDAELEQELAGIAATGARYLRMDFDWSHIGRREGALDWTATERVVRDAHACGLEVLGLLTYTPAWARPAGTGDHHPPTDPGDFAEFAAEAVRRFRPLGVRTWEIWNEPNIDAFWEPAPDPRDYAALLTAAYAALKAVDPDARVLTGGLSPAPDASDGTRIAPDTFLEGVYAADGDGHFDAIGHHPYSYPVLPLDSTGENAFADVTPRLFAVMQEHGDGDLEIWGTEIGAPTSEVLTPDFVAEYVTQAYAGWRDWSFTGPLIWYSYRDAGSDPDDPEDNFGLVRADFTPKEPALSAFEAAVDS